VNDHENEEKLFCVKRLRFTFYFTMVDTLARYTQRVEFCTPLEVDTKVLPSHSRSIHHL
jgi:hypothetical protein